MPFCRIKDITSVNKTFHISAKAKNSNLSRSNSNFSILTPTFSRDGFYESCFQNPSENSGLDKLQRLSLLFWQLSSDTSDNPTLNLRIEKKKCLNIYCRSDIFLFRTIECSIFWAKVALPVCTGPGLIRQDLRWPSKW